MARTAARERKTKETEVRLKLDLDGGEASIATGVGFLDHMLELLARHGRLGLRVQASGDLETGAHHTTEDVGIVLGQALDEALGDRAGIRRYGSALVPMDESLGECAIDISGRPYCAFDADLPPTTIAGFDTELTEEFFRSVASSAKRSEEHTSELQSRFDLVCRLLLEKKKRNGLASDNRRTKKRMNRLV